MKDVGISDIYLCIEWLRMNSFRSWITFFFPRSSLSFCLPALFLWPVCSGNWEYDIVCAFQFYIFYGSLIYPSKCWTVTTTTTTTTTPRLYCFIHQSKLGTVYQRVRDVVVDIIKKIPTTTTAKKTGWKSTTPHIGIESNYACIPSGAIYIKHF